MQYIKSDFITMNSEDFIQVKKYVLSTKTLQLHILLQLYSKIFDREVSEEIKNSFFDILEGNVFVNKSELKSVIQCLLKLNEINKAIEIIKSNPSSDLPLSVYFPLFKILIKEKKIDPLIFHKMITFKLECYHYSELFKLNDDSIKNVFFEKLITDLQTVNEELFNDILMIKKCKIYKCGHTLSGFSIRRSDALIIKEMIERFFVGMTKRQKTNWDAFKEMISKSQFDLIIDGANVGFFNNKGVINYSNIVSMVNKLSDKKILVLMNAKHKKEFDKFGPSIWTSCIWYSERCLYDDMYWLYASVSLNISVITNDKLSNVKSQLRNNDIFSVLEKIEKYKFIKHDENGLILPPNVIQVVDKHVHIPYNGQWTCIMMN